ncbi:MAG: shikimate dehydrogenase [Acidobacteria bacterium]|nr:MAG: shikimate dehydrogenase [Acidobacteriota bacterium]
MTSDHEIRVCVPLNERSFSALTAAANSARGVADIVEFRLDGLDEDELSNTKINDLVRAIQKPVILTYRPEEQGGYRSLTIQERMSFWQENFKSDAAFFDLELDLVKKLVNLDAENQPDWSRVICSHHDFKGPVPNLERIYEELAFTPARILKIAVTATDVVDCIEVFKLNERARREDRELIAIAMGDAGVTTRVLGPSFGSFLTYGALKPETGTAPGQLTTEDLKSVYRIHEIDTESMITGLVGKPVMHSVSPHMHNAAFQSVNINGVYLALEVRNVEQFFRRMVHPRTRELNWNLRGLSVTAPHKVEVMNYLDWIDPRAKEIGAVNTIVLENEQLLGYNTDCEGLVEPLLKRVGALDGARVAIIGAGGAANAAVYALREQKAEVTLYARDESKGRILAERFSILYEASLNANFAGMDVVINTTPLGSSGEHVNETPATSEQLRGSRLVYDLVYNPTETLLLREARNAGCETLGGLEMLVAQARQQFKIWTQTSVSSELMYNAATRVLGPSTSST